MPTPASQDTFEAGAFHPDYGTRRVTGTLSIDGGMATFTSDEGLFAFPLTGLQIKLGGASDRLVFLEHPNFPKVSIFTSDHAILDHPEFAQDRTLTRARDRIRRRKFVARCITFGLLALLIGAVAGVWFRPPWCRSKIWFWRFVSG